MPKKIPSGTYLVSVTVSKQIVVEDDDCYVDDKELVAECRIQGDVVDYEVYKQ